MLNINGETWRILLVSPNHPMLRRPNGLYSPGCCNDLNKTIYIDENVSDFYLRKILSHELVHACMYSYNIELSEEQEELLADLIATYGHDFINITNQTFNRLSDCRNKNKGESCFI